MSFSDLVAAVHRGPRDVDTLDELSRAALAEGEEEAGLQLILPAVEQSSSPLLWQWAGLLQRSIDDHEAAIRSFARAAALAPNDARIAHGRAQVALEAGVEAVALFLRARELAPNDGSVAIGLAAARHASGEGELAAAELRGLLARAPAWTEGYEHLAQLMSVLGQPERATQALEQAIAIFPREESLWATLFDIDIKSGNYPALARDLDRAAAYGVGELVLAPYRAIAAAELDNEVLPDALFGDPALSDELAIWCIRHLLRVGAIEKVLPLIDRELATDRAWSIWPYAAIAWKLSGDTRSKWLENDGRLVKQFDLTKALPPLDRLAGTLIGVHKSGGEFIDQSVRGGTQTDGPLLSRIDPTIRHLRRAIEQAVGSYVADLPSPDPRHPLLAHRRDRRIRFSGSWSVRLRGGGHHVSHVHPQGWISAALYISLPPRTPDDREEAGWLILGEPEEALCVPLAPSHKVEPREGHLVLFPSWMWHGTRPFHQGERLAMAFDVAHPR